MKTGYLIPAILLFVSCANQGDRTERLSANVMLTSYHASQHQFKNEYGVEGYYVGFFDAVQYDEEKNAMYRNKITVSIDSLDEQNVFGHSIVAGNMRPFKGNYRKAEKMYEVLAKEPGDDQYDGEFIFRIDPETKTINGIWKSYNKTLAVTEREYMLDKKQFVYDPSLELPEYLTYEGLYGTYQEDINKEEGLTDDVLKINASKVLLKTSDVENMYQSDLEVLRNSIYARHGYSFRNRKMRYLFDNIVEWYMPVSVDITGELTEIEKKNIDLIKRYELHAEKYYDVFGR